AGDGHLRAGDIEDAAGVIAADREAAGAGSVDRQVVGDAQFSAGEREGAADCWRESNGVRPGGGVGVQDGLAQRAGAGVLEVEDGERTGDGTVLQRFEGRSGAAGVASRAGVREGGRIAWVTPL